MVGCNVYCSLQLEGCAVNTESDAVLTKVNQSLVLIEQLFSKLILCI